jgi:methyltransferase
MTMELGVAHVIVLAVAAERLAELGYAGQNTRRLIARGGREIGAARYPVFVALHIAWLAALFVHVSRETPIEWTFLGIFLLLQLARMWVIITLGPYWTTRVITLPGAPLVRTGPYRLMPHPNYAIVIAEIAVLPLTFGAWTIAAVFTVLNALLIAYRIRLEDAALADRRRAAAAGRADTGEQRSR